MECNHYRGSFCVNCKAATNWCCGEDKKCILCNSETCRKCYDDDDVDRGCLQCVGKIITDVQICNYLLNKCGLERDDVVNEIKMKMKLGRW